MGYLISFHGEPSQQHPSNDPSSSSSPREWMNRSGRSLGWQFLANTNHLIHEPRNCFIWSNTEYNASTNYAKSVTSTAKSIANGNFQYHQPIPLSAYSIASSPK
jgi:hypothetical protein